MTAYELRISDWSSDVCSADLVDVGQRIGGDVDHVARPLLEAAHLARRLAKRSADLPGDLLRDRLLLRHEGIDRLAQDLLPVGEGREIGRASGRERVGQYV